MLHNKTKETKNSLCLCVIHTDLQVSLDVRDPENLLSGTSQTAVLKKKNKTDLLSDRTQGDIYYVPD